MLTEDYLRRSGWKRFFEQRKDDFMEGIRETIFRIEFLKEPRYVQDMRRTQGGDIMPEADVKQKLIRELELCAQELWHLGKQMNVTRLIGISEELSDSIHNIYLAWSIDEHKPKSPKYAIDKFGIAGRLIKDKPSE